MYLNGYLTNEFISHCGVRQGDTLSPTLFGLYINDLVLDLNKTGSGVRLEGNLSISSLLYADDLAIIAETEEGLQSQLDVLLEWCQKWSMRVNISKTKVVHYRTKTQPRSQCTFIFDNVNIDTVDKYKYLGIILDEHLDFNNTAAVLAGSGGRALGAIYTKFNKLKGLGYKTYTQLYHSGVTPILDYCSGIWGHQNFGKIDTVQNRAIRFYLGVHAFAPNLAVNGDMGWVSSGNRRKIEILRYWNRVVRMDDIRLTKKVFMWDRNKRRRMGNWSSDIYKIFNCMGLTHMYDNMDKIDIHAARDHLHSITTHQWATDIENVPKLRTYRTFKNSYETEPYVYKVFNRAHRSILAQFRCGILPIKVETGRFTQIPQEFRLCILCDSNSVEDERHFLFECSFYEDIRNTFFHTVENLHSEFNTLNYENRFKLLMSIDVVKLTANFVYTIYKKRRDFIYN